MFARASASTPPHRPGAVPAPTHLDHIQGQLIRVKEAVGVLLGPPLAKARKGAVAVQRAGDQDISGGAVFHQLDVGGVNLAVCNTVGKLLTEKLLLSKTLWRHPVVHQLDMRGVSATGQVL